MEIKKVIIHNIGCLNHFEVGSIESNVVIIKGSNSSGKTTILTAIFSLFSKEELFQKNERYPKKDATNDSFVALYFDNDDNSYVLRREFMSNESKFNLSSRNPFKSVSNLFDVYYIDTESLKTNFSAKQFERIKKFMETYDFEFTHMIGRNTSYLSRGELTIINVVYFLSLVPANSVVLMDSFLSCLDAYYTEAVLNLLKKLNYIQFFVAAQPCVQLGGEFVVVKLEENQVSHNSLSVNYEKIHTSILSENIADKNDEVILAVYKQDTIVKEEEDFEVEFKEIKGTNPCDSILKIAEQYIVAFLNSPVEGTGVVKWGINNDGVVKGVALNRANKDDLRTGLQKIVHEISPPITSGVCNLQFREVVDNTENLLADKYVVELKVKHVFSKKLYSTGKGEVYVKTNGVKQKLSPYEVQLEVLERNKIDNIIS